MKGGCPRSAHLMAPVVPVPVDQNDDRQDALAAGVDYQLDDALLFRLRSRSCTATSVRGR